MATTTTKNRLNFGCGEKILSGYVNVDIVKRPGVDKVIDLEKTPLRVFPASSIEVVIEK
jgi:predicted SAM-dependent methyltransferase